jgi:transketolase
MRYTGQHGAVLGMTTFGLSAPLAALQEALGFTTARVVDLATAQVAHATCLLAGAVR